MTGLRRRSRNTRKQNARPLIARHSASLAKCLVRWRWFALVLGLATLGPLWWAQAGLRVNRELAAMFAPDDPVLNDYQTLQSTFGGNVVVMLVYEDDLWSVDGVRRNRQWSTRVDSIEGVAGVLSVAKLVDVFAYLRPALPFSNRSEPALLDRGDPIAEQFRDLFEGYTHGPERSGRSTASIVAMIDPQFASRAVGALKTLSREMGNQAVLVGEPVLLEDAFDMIVADGRRLAIGTISLLCLVIVVSLQDLRIVLLSAASITWSTIATRALMVAWGIEMSLVSTILIAIVAVIVVASAMHLGVQRFRGAVTIERVLAGLAIPISLTCLTDAAGFASLMVSDVRPVTQFGVMTATAAMMVMVSLVLFAPAIMSLPDRLSSRWVRNASRSGHAVTMSVRHHDALRSMARWCVERSGVLSVLVVVTVLIGGIYVSRLTTNTSFLKNFRDDSSIVSAYVRIEDRLGGAGVMDVMIPAPDQITSEFLKTVRELEDRLRAIRVGSQHDVGLTKVLSLADADAVAAQVTMLSFVSPEVRLAGMRSAIPTFAEALLTFPNASDDRSSQTDQATEQRWLRIMLRTQEDLPGPDKTALTEAVRNEVESSVWKTSRRPVVTGYSVLMANLVSSLVRDQWWALTTALFFVGAILWWSTRRFGEMIAALAVNTIPILIVLACTGLFGGELDLGSAMIGAVSIGLSIDGSVHFLTGYHRRLRRGHAAVDAAIDSAADLGAPILLASLALVVGFAVLITSPFVPTSTFGLLVSVTLGLSSIANLTLLPALVIAFSRSSKVMR
ncbi:efflux RND transporter permease subunit [Neorhodopirellula pilleata]|uniref:MMPL family protein n=1 Tax=Neorhodopirellula pilleata TaxID=2714738 RepID=A0A5C5ZKV5_9BACT|nr:MMPL family transporter [Neorhodopirellula pilleata]TWT88052.1 MMPL family protein [Neorhodopirellula pilleata]